MPSPVLTKGLDVLIPNPVLLDALMPSLVYNFGEPMSSDLLTAAFCGLQPGYVLALATWRGLGGRCKLEGTPLYSCLGHILGMHSELCSMAWPLICTEQASRMVQCASAPVSVAGGLFRT